MSRSYDLFDYGPMVFVAYSTQYVTHYIGQFGNGWTDNPVDAEPIPERYANIIVGKASLPLCIVNPRDVVSFVIPGYRKSGSPGSYLGTDKKGHTIWHVCQNDDD